ncbi:MAG: dCTP deaminase [Proteobacteria bacterium ST_bin12]|nr:MAG: dCTP deaminase [Proteobacteria bacterium ST_bin12]
MSVLSRAAILEALKDEDLVVSPILNKEQIGMTSIDLRMGTVVMMARAGAQSHVDPVMYDDSEGHDALKEKYQKHERFEIPFRHPFLLHPGALALVPTLEWVVLPHYLQGVVTARSSWAREGLNIATANFVNPGYKGIITLELANLGEIPIRLYLGLRIAQIAFYDLNIDRKDETKKEVYKGQFKMNFEPKAGDLTKFDHAFLPPKKP